MKFLNYILVACIVVLLVIVDICNDNCNDLKMEIEQMSEGQNEKNYQLNMYFHNSIVQSIENENIGIDISEWEALNSKTFLVDLDKPILIFKYSIYSCMPCVDFIYDELMITFGNKLDKVNQLLFLCSDSNPLMKGKIIQTINLGTKSLKLPIEKEGVPFLFVLNKGKVESVFIPNTTFPEYTGYYLKEIKKKYFI